MKQYRVIIKHKYSNNPDTYDIQLGGVMTYYKTFEEAEAKANKYIKDARVEGAIAYKIQCREITPFETVSEVIL